MSDRIKISIPDCAFVAHSLRRCLKMSLISQPHAALWYRDTRCGLACSHCLVPGYVLVEFDAL
jgi:hypothetical protein